MHNIEHEDREKGSKPAKCQTKFCSTENFFDFHLCSLVLVHHSHDKYDRIKKFIDNLLLKWISNNDINVGDGVHGIESNKNSGK